MIQERIAESIRKHGEQVAIEKGEISITFQELHLQTKKVTQGIQQQQIPNHTFIGVCMEDRLDYIISIMGIIGAGCVFVPIDIAMPRNRIQLMLRTTRTEILIVDTAAKAKLENHEPENKTELLFLDVAQLIQTQKQEHTPEEIKARPEDPLYVYFTSGTTGTPKAFIGKHIGLLHFIHWEIHTFQMQSFSRISQLTTPVFDAFLRDLFVPLLSGGVICIPGDNQTQLQEHRLRQWIEKSRLTIIHSVPSLFRMMVSKTMPPQPYQSLKTILLSGERLHPSDLENWYNIIGERVQLVNLWGTSETTLAKTSFRISSGDVHTEKISIGKPIKGARVLVLDKDNKTCQQLEKGELYIQTPFRTLGYCNEPERTADTFIQNPLTKESGDRIHRTGDLGRWQPDGNLELLGRTDRQVKVRGIRVELEEIERKILDYKENKGGEARKKGNKDPFEIYQQAHRCQRCLLTDKYPGITYDQKGECNQCQEFQQKEQQIMGYFQGIWDFKQLMKKTTQAKKSTYDCMLLYSGGKDSSYVLYRLKEMGYQVLAFTFDNGYISETAFKNIKLMTERLHVDHVISQAPRMKEIFVESLRTDHTVCTGCFQALATQSIKIATEGGINVIITGLSEGQIIDQRLESLYKAGVYEVEEIEKEIPQLRKMYYSRNDKVSRILDITIPSQQLDNIHFIDFFRYDHATITEVKAYLREKDKDWEKPTDTGMCSTNCRINDVGIYVHIKETGYHNYDVPLSWDTRLGKYTREQGLEELMEKLDPEEIHRILKEIGYQENPVTQAKVMAMGEPGQDPYLTAYITVSTPIPQNRILDYLSQELPGYMVPSRIFQLEKIPLTLNGKVDYTALKEIEKRDQQKHTMTDPPTNHMEVRLKDIWTSILGTKPFGIQGSFIELGGNSLSIMTLISRIHQEFDVRISLGDIFNHPTIKTQAEKLSRATKKKYQSIHPTEDKEYYPLTSGQSRLWFFLQMLPTTTAYNMPTILEVEGNLEENHLRNIFNTLIQRHESLRTSFGQKNGIPIQRILPQVEFLIETREQEPGEQEPDLTTLIKSFDLTQAPLIRVILVKTKGNTENGKEQQYQHHSLLIIDMHHIISDGYSIHHLIQEFATLYRKEALPQLRLQYRDYTEWQNQKENQEARAEQRQYWMEQFRGDLPQLELPTDNKRPKEQTFEGNRKEYQLCPKETTEIKKLAQKDNVTLFMMTVALYKTFLYKITGQTDIIIGIPIAGRRHQELSQVMGMFVNMLALRSQPKGEITFREYLKEIKKITLQVFENQDYAFEDLVESLDLQRDTARNPIFDVVYVMQNIGETFTETDEKDLHLPGITIKAKKFENPTSKFDLTLFATEIQGTLQWIYEYSTALFKQETIHRYHGYFQRIIATVLQNPEIPLGKIQLLNQEEKETILTTFNQTHRPYPEEKSILHFYQEKTHQQPGRVALDENDQVITYQQLEAQTQQMAEKLRRKGVQKNDIVGMLMPGTSSMVMTMISILKAGGAYLPIEITLPLERIRYQLKDSGSPMLITHTQLKEKAQEQKETTLIYGDQELNALLKEKKGKNQANHISRKSGDLAYVIYTSGTTGKPKGTLIHDHNVTRLVCQQENITITEEERILQLSNYAFDGSVFDIYGALLNGATLILLKQKGQMNIEKVNHTLLTKNITLFLAPTALFNALVDQEPSHLGDVRHILVGGEEISKLHLKKAWKHLNMGPGRIINAYGPTETTVYVATYPIDDPENPGPIPIGTPISNTTLYILDATQQLAPIGVTGELYIGGKGLASGYLNQPEMTAEKFISNPFKNNQKERLYRTGDMSRWQTNGNVEYRGRKDFQVKIRGYRVELKEIETQIQLSSKVKKAVVLIRGEGDQKTICAYIETTQTQATASEQNNKILNQIKQHLSSNLPEYMEPLHYIILETIPITPNGKVDYKKLPLPEIQKNQESEPPKGKTENKLAHLWKQILGTEAGPITRDTDFFKIGGHSLRAATLANLIYKEFQVKITITQIFQTPTISALAGQITGFTTYPYQQVQPAEKKEYYPLTPPQKRIYLLQQMDKHSIAWHMPQVNQLKGELSLEKFEKAFQQLIERHESLRTSIPFIEGEPLQKIETPERIKFKIEPLQIEPGLREPWEIITSYLKPFNLEQAPLVRVGVIQETPMKHLVIVDIHHIVSDGTSHEILVRDFIQLYQGNSLKAMRIQYKDYAEWQRTHKGKTKEWKDQETYWMQQFSGEMPILNLPADFPRPEKRSLKGQEYPFEIKKEETKHLKKLAAETGTTLFMLLLAALNVLLSKYSNQTDLVIGTVTAGRPHPDLKEIIGMFLHTLPLRNKLEPHQLFTHYLEQVRKNTLEAYENQSYPFEEMIKKLAINREANRNPLFEVMLILQNFETQGESESESKSKLGAGAETGIGKTSQEMGIQVTPLEFQPGTQHQTSKYEMTMYVQEHYQELVCSIEYSTSLFKASTIKQMASDYQQVLEQVTRNRDVLIQEIQLETALYQTEEIKKEEITFNF